MTSLLFSGYLHVIKNVITSYYRILSAGTSNFLMTFMTTMQFIIETNFEGKKNPTFERSYDKQNLTLVIISHSIY